MNIFKTFDQELLKLPDIANIVELVNQQCSGRFASCGYSDLGLLRKGLTAHKLSKIDEGLGGIRIYGLDFNLHNGTYKCEVRSGTQIAERIHDLFVQDRSEEDEYNATLLEYCSFEENSGDPSCELPLPLVGKVAELENRENSLRSFTPENEPLRYDENYQCPFTICYHDSNVTISSDPDLDQAQNICSCNCNPEVWFYKVIGNSRTKYKFKSTGPSCEFLEPNFVSNDPDCRCPRGYWWVFGYVFFILKSKDLSTGILSSQKRNV